MPLVTEVEDENLEQAIADENSCEDAPTEVREVAELACRQELHAEREGVTVHGHGS